MRILNGPTATLTTATSRRRTVQLELLFVAIVLTAISGLAVSLWFPTVGADGGWFTYATVEPERTFFWAFLTLAGVNLVITVVPAALAALLLVPERGWAWATAGFGVATLGCAFYAVGIGGWASVYFFATDASALDPAIASAFIESVNSDGFRVWGAAGFGAVLVGAGTVLLSIGLWRSRSVPRWLPALAVAGTVIALMAPDGTVGVVVESPQAISSVLIGWYAWQGYRAGVRHAQATAQAAT